MAVTSTQTKPQKYPEGQAGTNKHAWRALGAASAATLLGVAAVMRAGQRRTIRRRQMEKRRMHLQRIQSSTHEQQEHIGHLRQRTEEIEHLAEQMIKKIQAGAVAGGLPASLDTDVLVQMGSRVGHDEGAAFAAQAFLRSKTALKVVAAKARLEEQEQETNALIRTILGSGDNATAAEMKKVIKAHTQLLQHNALHLHSAANDLFASVAQMADEHAAHLRTQMAERHANADGLSQQLRSLQEIETARAKVVSELEAERQETVALGAAAEDTAKLRQAIVDSSQRTLNLERQLGELKQSKTALQEELQQLQQDHKQTLEKNQRMFEDEKRREVTALQAQLVTVQARLKTAHGQAETESSLRRDQARLQEKLAAAQANLNRVIQEHTHQIAELKNTHARQEEHHKAETEKREAALQQLKAEHQTEIETTVAEMRKQVKREYANKLAEMERTQEELQSSIADIGSRNAKIAQEKGDLQGQLRELQEEMQELKREHENRIRDATDELGKKLAKEHGNKLAEMERRQEQLQATIAEINSHKEAIKHEKSELQSQLQQLHDNMQAQTRERNQRITEVQEELRRKHAEEYQQEKQRLAEQYRDEARQLRERLTRESQNAFTSQVDQLRRQLEGKYHADLAVQAEDIQQRLAQEYEQKFQKREEALRTQLAGQSQQEVTKQVEGMQKQLTQEYEQKLKTQVDAMRSNLAQQHLEERQKALDALRQEHGKIIQQKADTLAAALVSHDTQIKSKTHELDALRASHKQKEDALAQQIQEKNARLQELRNALNIADASDELDAISKLHDRQRVLDQELATIKQQKESRLRDLTSAEAENEKLQRRVQDLTRPQPLKFVRNGVIKSEKQKAKLVRARQKDHKETLRLRAEASDSASQAEDRERDLRAEIATRENTLAAVQRALSSVQGNEAGSDLLGTIARLKKDKDDYQDQVHTLERDRKLKETQFQKEIGDKDARLAAIGRLLNASPDKLQGQDGLLDAVQKLQDAKVALEKDLLQVRETARADKDTAAAKEAKHSESMQEAQAQAAHHLKQREGELARKLHEQEDKFKEIVEEVGPLPGEGLVDAVRRLQGEKSSLERDLQATRRNARSEQEGLRERIRTAETNLQAVAKLLEIPAGQALTGEVLLQALRQIRSEKDNLVKLQRLESAGVLQRQFQSLYDEDKSSQGRHTTKLGQTLAKRIADLQTRGAEVDATTQMWSVRLALEEQLLKLQAEVKGASATVEQQQEQLRNAISLSRAKQAKAQAKEGVLAAKTPDLVQALIDSQQEEVQRLETSIKEVEAARKSEIAALQKAQTSARDQHEETLRSVRNTLAQRDAEIGSLRATQRETAEHFEKERQALEATLKKEQNDAQQAADAAAQHTKALEAKLTALTDEVREARGISEQARADAHHLEEQLTVARTDTSSWQTKLNTAQMERDDFARKASEARQEALDVNEELKASKAAMVSLQDRLRENQAKLETAKAQKAGVATQQAQVQNDRINELEDKNRRLEVDLSRQAEAHERNLRSAKATHEQEGMAKELEIRNLYSTVVTLTNTLAAYEKGQPAPGAGLQQQGPHDVGLQQMHRTRTQEGAMRLHIQQLSEKLANAAAHKKELDAFYVASTAVLAELKKHPSTSPGVRIRIDQVLASIQHAMISTGAGSGSGSASSAASVADASRDAAEQFQNLVFTWIKGTDDRSPKAEQKIAAIADQEATETTSQRGAAQRRLSPGGNLESQRQSFPDGNLLHDTAQQKRRLSPNDLHLKTKVRPPGTAQEKRRPSLGVNSETPPSSDGNHDSAQGTPHVGRERSKTRSPTRHGGPSLRKDLQQRAITTGSTRNNSLSPISPPEKKLRADSVPH